MSTPSWLRPLIASWKINIIRSPAMSAPSLAVTAIRLAVYTKKIWLACNVCALVGCDRRRQAGQ